VRVVFRPETVAGCYFVRKLPMLADVRVATPQPKLLREAIRGRGVQFRYLQSYRRRRLPEVVKAKTRSYGHEAHTTGRTYG
jgi:hypothetical protein